MDANSLGDSDSLLDDYLDDEKKQVCHVEIGLTVKSHNLV